MGYMIYLLGHTHGYQEPWGSPVSRAKGAQGILEQMLTSSVLPRHREPDSTYFDLPQPSRGNSEASGSEDSSMAVFPLQGMVSDGC